jgi:hypothetical protein
MNWLLGRYVASAKFEVVDMAVKYDTKHNTPSLLPGDIMESFDQACAEGDYEIGLRLLKTLERLLLPRDSTGSFAPVSLDMLVEAHRRLWYLRTERAHSPGWATQDRSKELVYQTH